MSSAQEHAEAVWQAIIAENRQGEVDVDGEPISLGEISRILTRVENRVDRMDGKLDQLPYVRSDLYGAESARMSDRVQSIERRLDEHDDGHKWLSRSLIVAATGALLSLVVAIVAALVK